MSEIGFYSGVNKNWTYLFKAWIVVDPPGLQRTILHGQENENHQNQSPGNGGKYNEKNHCYRRGVQEREKTVVQGSNDEEATDDDNNDNNFWDDGDNNDDSFF